jgi:plastocyanin
MTAGRIRRASTIAMVVAALGVSACGDDEDEPAASQTPEATATETPAATPAAEEGEKLALAASEDGGLSFDPKGLEAKAGTVTVTLDNPSGNQMPHNVVIEGNGVDAAGPIAQPGGTSAATADLKAGTYTFYCAVGQHRQNGMEGKLTVE